MKTTTELTKDVLNALQIAIDKANVLLNASDIVAKPVKEKYIFKAGDIARNCEGEIKFIVRQLNGGLCSFGEVFRITTTGQKEFESWDYKKIGELKDLLKNFPKTDNSCPF